MIVSIIIGSEISALLLFRMLHIFLLFVAPVLSVVLSSAVLVKLQEDGQLALRSREGHSCRPWLRWREKWRRRLPRREGDVIGQVSRFQARRCRCGMVEIELALDGEVRCRRAAGRGQTTRRLATCDGVVRRRGPIFRVGLGATHGLRRYRYRRCSSPLRLTLCRAPFKRRCRVATAACRSVLVRCGLLPDSSGSFGATFTRSLITTRLFLGHRLCGLLTSRLCAQHRASS